MPFNDFVTTVGIPNINDRECLGFKQSGKKPQSVIMYTIHKPSARPHWNTLSAYRLALEQEEDRNPHRTVWFHHG